MRTSTGPIWPGLLAACVGLAGCDRTDEPGVANEPPGGLIVFGDDAVWELRDGPGDMLHRRQIAPYSDRKVVAAELTRDRRTLVYLSTPELSTPLPEPDATSLVVRDLASGRERVLVQGLPTVEAGDPMAFDCLELSPDGRRALTMGRAGHDVRARALVVLDLAGRGKPLILERERFVAGEGDGRGGYTELTCGRWLDDDRVVFDRGTRGGVAADTTTVARLDGETVHLADSTSRWLLVAACRGRFLLRQGVDLYFLTAAPSDSVWIRPRDRVSLPGTELYQNGLLDGVDRWLVDFHPSTCEPFLVLIVGRHSIHRIDVGTREVQQVRSIDGALGVSYWPDLADTRWPFKPDRPAWWTHGTTETLAILDFRIQLLDVSTGRVTYLPKEGSVEEILGWAPSGGTVGMPAAPAGETDSSAPLSALAIATASTTDPWYRAGGLDLCAGTDLTPLAELARRVERRAADPTSRTRDGAASCTFEMRSAAGRAAVLRVEARAHASVAEAETEYLDARGKRRGVVERIAGIGDRAEGFSVEKAEEPRQRFHYLLHARARNLILEVGLEVDSEEAAPRKDLAAKVRAILEGTLALVSRSRAEPVLDRPDASR